MSASKQLNLDFAALPVGADSQRQPPVHVRRSTRAKHLQIRVSPWKGVELIVPLRRSAREVEGFLVAHADWIDQAWQRLLKEYPQAGVLQLPESIDLPFLERQWQVSHGAHDRLRETGDRLFLPRSEDHGAIAVQLQAWLKKQAQRCLPSRLAAWSERTGLHPERVVIRGQATRWGSCSTRNTISLNFRLLFLEKPEVDCLLLHELCHLKHLNHGKRFWALMEKHMPGARERDRRLGEGWKRVPPWALVR